jgi:hypothetical protein
MIGLFLELRTIQYVVLGDVIYILLAIGREVREFKPGWAMNF